MGIGDFSEPRAKTRHTGVNVGETSIGLNDNKTKRNNVMTIKSGIGKRHDPSQYYTRKSGVKSAGGYAMPEESEGE